MRQEQHWEEEEFTVKLKKWIERIDKVKVQRLQKKNDQIDSVNAWWKLIKKKKKKK